MLPRINGFTVSTELPYLIGGTFGMPRLGNVVVADVTYLTLPTSTTNTAAPFVGFFVLIATGTEWGGTSGPKSPKFTNTYDNPRREK